MICPKCKKQETTEVKINKQHKDVQRERYCSGCDFSFTTIEKIKNYKKRKPRLKKLLMNYRFYLYGVYRAIKLLKVHSEVIKKITPKKLKNYDTAILNIPIKSGIVYRDKSSEDMFVKYVEGKKQTIESIISEPYYWNFKNVLFNKQLISDDDIKTISLRLKNSNLKNWRIKTIKEGDKKEKDLAIMVLKELEEFHKSVSTYIKTKEYNRDFFINYKFEDLDLKDISKYHSTTFSEMKDYWKTDWFWQYYLYGR